MAVRGGKVATMTRYLALILLGVPIPVLILMWFMGW
jgi:hypothetical protein